jgi:hypothetical protein
MSKHCLHEELLDVTYKLVLSNTDVFDNLNERWYDNYIAVRGSIYRGWTIDLEYFIHSLPPRMRQINCSWKHMQIEKMRQGEKLPPILKWDVKEERVWHISFIKKDNKLVSMNIKCNFNE